MFAMRKILTSMLRRFIILAGRILFRISMRITVTGYENVPGKIDAPTILVANHFSWFDAPLLTTFLPHTPIFLTAEENLRNPLMGGVIRLFNGIPVRRGHADRRALDQMQDAVAARKLVAIFPEGGVQPEFIQRAGRGEEIHHYLAYLTRDPIRLIPPRAGTAYVATQSNARILPVALIGTNTIIAEWRAFRRPQISIIIGPMTGPYTIDNALNGRAKRQQLDHIAHEIMRRLARLLPAHLRGPYR